MLEQLLMSDSAPNLTLPGETGIMQPIEHDPADRILKTGHSRLTRKPQVAPVFIALLAWVKGFSSV